jgi:triphosphoribosyl-dephospho-CoA synthase
MHRLAEEPDYTLGQGILDSIRISITVQKGGNTHLGTILLFAPIAKAAGQVDGDITDRKLRNALGKVLLSTTNKDAVDAYNAINLAPVGGLNDVPELDVRDHKTLEQIQSGGMNLVDWMRVGSNVNSVAYEYVNDFRLSFEVALPVLTMHAPTKMDKAIIHTFLTLLAIREDSHIMGKFGEGVAEDVKARAACILEKGSVWKKTGLNALKGFNCDLRKKGISPGTTADLTASTIFIGLLLGMEI